MTDHISGELSSSMAHQYEELLRAAICKALGISDWSWNEDDIRGRVVRVITGSSEQTWVDGRLVFEVLPIEVTTDCTGHSTYIKASRKYRSFV